jgi:hypothetical protein
MSAPAISPLTGLLLLFAATTRSQSNDGETPVLLSPAPATSGFEERFEPERKVVPTFMRPEVISTVSVLSSKEGAGGDASAASPMPVSGQEDAVAVLPPSSPPPLPHARASDGEAVMPLRQTATPTETASTPPAQVRPKRRSIAKPKPWHQESRSRALVGAASGPKTDRPNVRRGTQDCTGNRACEPRGASTTARPDAETREVRVGTSIWNDDPHAVPSAGRDHTSRSVDLALDLAARYLVNASKPVNSAYIERSDCAPVHTLRLPIGNDFHRSHIVWFRNLH